VEEALKEEVSKVLPDEDVLEVKLYAKEDVYVRDVVCTDELVEMVVADSC
jgi:hypothetical protein